MEKPAENRRKHGEKALKTLDVQRKEYHIREVRRNQSDLFKEYKPGARDPLSCFMTGMPL